MKIESIVVWDAGMYAGKILRCESAESTLPGKEGQLRFKFVIRLTDPQSDEYNDIPYYTNTTLSKHENAKLRPMVRALLPDLDLDDPEVAASLDTDDLVGKRCRVVLGISEKSGKNTVDKVLAPETPKSRAVAAARPAAVDDEPAPATSVPF